MLSGPLSSFSQDRLDRESLADYLTHFITTSQPTTNEYSRVIALDSSWGTGKTSFVNMWIEKLENNTEDASFACLKYNAWENDDSPDALIPIICSFQQLINESTAEGKIQKNKLLKIITTFGLKTAGIMSQCVLGADLVEKGIEACQEYRDEKYPNMIFEEYTARQENKNLFKELADAVRGDRALLLICIDELDRCRPTFAIETLEVVKHFFDLPNVVFVFSLDMKQLHHSIKTIYGDIDSMGYLQRFFDYQISFPRPKLRKFLRERLVDHDRNPLDVDVSILENFAERLSLSLRSLNVICKAYAHFIRRKEQITRRHHGKFPNKYQQVYLALFCMKYADPFGYINFLHNGTVIENQEDKLWIELFGWRNSTIDAYQSCYTKKIADTPLFVFFHEQRDSNIYQYAKQCFLVEDEFRYCDRVDFRNTTLSQAIYNNIEYGCVFPTEDQLTPE